MRRRIETAHQIGFASQDLSTRFAPSVGLFWRRTLAAPRRAERPNTQAHRTQAHRERRRFTLPRRYPAHPWTDPIVAGGAILAGGQRRAKQTAGINGGQERLADQWLTNPIVDSKIL